MKEVQVVLNGRSVDLPYGTTIAEVVELLSPAPHGDGHRGVAVAINEEVVPRSGWPTVTIGQGDRIDVLVAAQGG